VGARGRRTQQRILDAALQVFGDEGYHRGSVDRITKLGGCSRVSFYQYFASKEDVFGHLAAQVVRQLSASTEALDALTPDRDGWAATRAWVTRYAEIYARYEPIFNAYQVAVESDEFLTSLSARTGDESVARIHARLAAPTLPSRQIDPVIRLLLETTAHTLDVTGILRSVEPTAYPGERVADAITDVFHRTMFGARAGVNVRAIEGSPPPALRSRGTMLEMVLDDAPSDAASAQNRAFAALLASGRDVFLRRGYHSTRVDDLVAAAGVSHGAFYRYFRNKEELARILAARALRTVGAALTEIPDLGTGDGSGGNGALRRWLRRYHAAHAEEAAMLRVWVDAALQEAALRADFAAPLDWGRRRLARLLRPRDFGDVDMDAVVMVALLGVFGARPRPAADVDAAGYIVERGLLGRVS
jgi:AcrR family transcriptional regulator